VFVSHVSDIFNAFLPHLYIFCHVVPLEKMDGGFTVQKFASVCPQIIIIIFKYFKSSHWALVNITATLA
jgi:hypothetical protein